MRLRIGASLFSIAPRLCHYRIGFFDCSGMLYPLLDGRVFGRFWCVGHGSANRVQINLGHAGDQGSLVQQGLGFEAAFPESARTLIFGIGFTSNGFM
jgi:hypothetical protein